MRHFRILCAFVMLLLSACAGLHSDQEYAEGMRLLKSQQYGEAYTHALKAYNERPDVIKYQSLLGWTHLKQGNLTEARRLFSDLYAHDQYSIPACMGLAWAEYSSGNLDQAEGWFQKELTYAKGHADDPANFVAYSPTDQGYINSCLSDANYGLGLVSLAKQDYSKARSYLSHALKYPNDFIGHGPIRTSLADAFYFQGNYAEALKIYRELQNEPGNESVALKLGWCLYYTGDYSQGEKIFLKQLNQATDQRAALYGLVFAAQARNQSAASKTWLEKLIKADPYSADTPQVSKLIEQNREWKILQKEFARGYLQMGDFSLAQKKLHAYLLHADRDDEARTMDAWCDLYLNRLPLALSKFETLSQGKKPNIQAVLGRGVTKLYLGKLDAAEADFKQVQAREPNNVRARVARGAVAYLRGNLPRAIQIYTTNLRFLPEKEPFFSWSSHALNNLGWSYIRTGQYQEALQVFQRLKNHHPRPIYPEAFNGLGWAYLYLGKTGEAQQEFQQALKLAPGYVSAQTGLAKIAAAQR